MHGADNNMQLYMYAYLPFKAERKQTRLTENTR